MATIFTDGTLWSQTKLDMINSCLLGIGEAPLPAGTAPDALPEGTDGYVAKLVVEETMVEVQNRGWFFNTDAQFLFTLDEFGFIATAPNLLRIDAGASGERGNVIIKQAKLWNLRNQTFIWDADVTLKAIWLVDYADLPAAAFQYIALRSARKFQQRVIGSESLFKYTELDEQEAHTNMVREHMQYKDFNILDNRAISRKRNPRGI